MDIYNEFLSIQPNIYCYPIQEHRNVDIGTTDRVVLL